MKQQNLKITPDSEVSYNDKTAGITEVHIAGTTNSVNQDSEKQFSGEKAADNVVQDIFGALNY